MGFYSESPYAMKTMVWSHSLGSKGRTLQEGSWPGSPMTVNRTPIPVTALKVTVLLCLSPDSVSLSKPITVPLELSGLALIVLAIHRTDSPEPSCEEAV